jgi:hypothetical protein
MLIHDIIKIKYVKLGYIKRNYPYHLISDEEMFNAFIDLGNSYFNKKSTLIDEDVRFFDDYYPNPFSEDDIYQKKNAKGEVVDEIKLADEYTKLKDYIVKTINDYLAHRKSEDAGKYQIPDWLYTYMLGEVVYQKSDYLDIEDTLELLKCSNLDNIFTKEACIACYVVSMGYISTSTLDVRPLTMFGEPHVIKQLRLET